MTRRAHLAVFLPSLAGGGAERVMLELAQRLAHQGDRIDLVLSQAIGPYSENIPADIRVADLKARRMIGAIVPLARWLRRVQPDVLISTLAYANVAALIAVYLSGINIRVVLREANTPSASGRRNLKEALVVRMANYAYRHADVVVAVSGGVAEELAGSGVPQARIRIVPNPVNCDMIAEAASEKPDHSWLSAVSGPPTILAVGRLTKQKGFDVLLDAFALLRMRRVARLVILGEGEQRDALVEQAMALGIHDDLDMPGFKSNPYAYMSRAAVFVLSSRWEGLPNVLIQALACGCRCVSTDCPNGPSEILEEGRYGELVPVGDSEALAGAIERSLSLEQDNERLRYYSRRYHVDNLIGQWRSVIIGREPKIGGNTS